MLKFSFRDFEVPPDRLRYKAPDGHTIEATDRFVWYSKIKKHYADNGIPLPENIEALAQDQLCRILPPGWCRHEDGTGFAGINVRLELGDLFRGMEILTTVATSSEPLVSQEVAEERAAKCAACPANVPVAGCLPCMGMPNLIVKIKGAHTTKADPFLKTCACCKCLLTAKVWVKPEILAKADDPTIRAQMRGMPDCWAVQEIDKLESQAS
jgi:hypothetical protein